MKGREGGSALLEAWRAVREFHEVFGLPIGERPQLHVEPNRSARISWMREEVTEFEDATDIVGQADAMVDLIYFALGTLVEMGVEPSRLFEIVQEANMAKRWPDGTVHRDPVGKVIKPPGWQDPRPAQEREVASQSCPECGDTGTVTIFYERPGNPFPGSFGRPCSQGCPRREPKFTVTVTEPKP